MIKELFNQLFQTLSFRDLFQPTNKYPSSFQTKEKWREEKLKNTLLGRRRVPQFQLGSRKLAIKQVTSRPRGMK